MSAITGFPKNIVDNVIERVHRYPKFDENRQDRAIELLQGPEDVMNASLQKYHTDVTIHDYKTARHTVSCECADRYNRGLYCKHIIALFAYLYIVHDTENAAAETPTIGENVIDDPADSATDIFEIRPEDY
jgi:hypothetical protein